MMNFKGSNTWLLSRHRNKFFFASDGMQCRFPIGITFVASDIGANWFILSRKL